PNGAYALKSHFYLAELYSKKELPENAQSHYEYVVNASSGEFTEQAMVKLSQIYLNESNWDSAIPLLLRLEAEANYPQNKTYAQSNLMNAYFQIENYLEATSYGEKTLQYSKLDDKVKGDAQIIIARSAIKLGDEEKAKVAYSKVESAASGVLVAEALYYNAYFKNMDGNFQASNTVVQNLVKSYSSYKYFSSKGLIVMAKNFYALDDAFQATYILESVISNFEQFEDVVADAQSELDRIKTEEAKTNASVETDQN
ncbi:MAG: hypothetical protein HRU26_15525, partial [Psychroserpens sp.]|nr:hypothetical protein [Psychroserpens sp.]